MDDLLTSAEAAELLGVSPSTVKRWADDGVLTCAKTAGKHRRFEREVVEAFGRAQARGEAGTAPALAGWWHELVAADTPYPLEARLLEERGRRGSWWAVCDGLGAVLEQIGLEWAAGRLTILEEHQVSERLSRALHRLAEWLPASRSAPTALLATAEGDEHTLGLSCAELCLREAGWTVRWAGRRTPTDELVRAIGVDDAGFRLVALSASQASSKPRALAAQATAVAAACKRRGVGLVLGGTGAWPDPPPHGVRLRDFRALHEYVRWLPD